MNFMFGLGSLQDTLLYMCKFIPKRKKNFKLKNMYKMLSSQAFQIISSNMFDYIFLCLLGIYYWKSLYWRDQIMPGHMSCFVNQLVQIVSVLYTESCFPALGKDFFFPQGKLIGNQEYESSFQIILWPRLK